MLAALCTVPDPTDPLSALILDDVAEPDVPPGWVRVRMRSASLNMRDVSTLRGAGLDAAAYPTIIGNDGAGVLDDGTEVIVHSSVPSPGWLGDEALDPRRRVLSDGCPGTFAELVAIPASSAVPKPPELTFAEAACLPTAWLTAYRMLFVTAGCRPGDVVVVRGRRGLGSIATAAIALGGAAGLQVHVLGDPSDARVACDAGAIGVVATVDELPSGLTAALDAAGGAHDLLWAADRLRPGGAIVCSGYRVGDEVVRVSADGLHAMVFGELRLLGSGMGTAADLAALAGFLVATGVRPAIAGILPLRSVGVAMSAMLTGTVSGKLVFDIPG